MSSSCDKTEPEIKCNDKVQSNISVSERPPLFGKRDAGGTQAKQCRHIHCDIIVGDDFFYTSPTRSGYGYTVRFRESQYWDHAIMNKDKINQKNYRGIISTSL